MLVAIRPLELRFDGGQNAAWSAPYDERMSQAHTLHFAIYPQRAKNLSVKALRPPLVCMSSLPVHGAHKNRCRATVVGCEPPPLHLAADSEAHAAGRRREAEVKRGLSIAIGILAI